MRTTTGKKYSWFLLLLIFVLAIFGAIAARQEVHKVAVVFDRLSAVPQSGISPEAGKLIELSFDAGAISMATAIRQNPSVTNFNGALQVSVAHKVWDEKQNEH